VIVVDTSAIVAILRREADAPVLRAEIVGAARALVSSVSVVELAAVASRDEALFEDVRAFLNEPFVVVEPVDPAQARVAVEAYRRYGKGRHPAGLNLGDVFPYALARQRSLPLLFTGNDFSQTDIRSATDERLRR